MNSAVVDLWWEPAVPVELSARQYRVDPC
jgi:hypothetical protein